MTPEEEARVQQIESRLADVEVALLAILPAAAQPMGVLEDAHRRFVERIRERRQA